MLCFFSHHFRIIRKFIIYVFFITNVPHIYMYSYVKEFWYFLVGDSRTLHINSLSNFDYFVNAHINNYLSVFKMLPAPHPCDILSVGYHIDIRISYANMNTPEYSLFRTLSHLSNQYSPSTIGIIFTCTATIIDIFLKTNIPTIHLAKMAGWYFLVLHFITEPLEQISLVLCVI